MHKLTTEESASPDAVPTSIAQVPIGTDRTDEVFQRVAITRSDPPPTRSHAE
jgi:hypothetical protein